MSGFRDERRSDKSSKAQPYGEVFDRGYRHYAGRRGGRTEVVRALTMYSIKRGLGIKKRWTAKIIPFALCAIAFLPVIIAIGAPSLAGQQAEKPPFTYFELYGMISLIILLVGATVAPEMLCDERRDGVLRLYFSRGIGRVDYLVAKVGALGLLIATVAFLPALLLFLGNTFLNADPLSYLAHNADDLGRILASGALIALFYASISLAVSSFVNRKGIAATVLVGGVLVLSGIAAALFDAISASWHRYIVLANPVMIPEGILRWLFDTTVSNGSQVERAQLDGVWYVLSVALVALICGGVMYQRYSIED